MLIKRSLWVGTLCFLPLPLLAYAPGPTGDNSSPTAPFHTWDDGSCSSANLPYTGYAPPGFQKIVRIPLVLAAKAIEQRPTSTEKGSNNSEQGGMANEAITTSEVTPKSENAAAKAIHYLIPSTTVTRLYAGQQLIVDVTTDRYNADLPLIAIAFQSSAATPINPAPLRPTQSLGRTKPETAKHVCASTVVQADNVVTVAVSGIANDDGSVVPLISYALPQVHVLDFFNISTGIAASNLIDNTFNRVIKTASDPTKSPAVPATYTTTQGKTGRRVAPALFFTWYLFDPLDPEVPFHASDLTPEPTIGFSLTNPGDDYFFGASSELFVRNVQLVYGFHYGKFTELTANQVDDPFSSAAQLSQRKFVGKAFVGVTFNIDFIKRVFGK